jgi:hypothetical protein
MRILANYGHRSNGDSYSVTFEQTGDVPMERAEGTIDELFRLAKEAVQRQIDGDLSFPPKEEVVVPKNDVTIPKVASSYNGNGNGNGNGATEKQKNFLKKLHAEKRKGVNIESLSKFEASQIIKELMEV